MKSSKHIKNAAGAICDTKKIDAHMTNQSAAFNSDLCHAMVSANIPIWKWRTSQFKISFKNTQDSSFHTSQLYE